MSITIFCRPEEIPQPASIGGEATCSEDMPGAIIIGTLDGLDRAAFTSRRILGSGPSLEAALWGRRGLKKKKTDYRMKVSFLLNRVIGFSSPDVHLWKQL